MSPAVGESCSSDGMGGDRVMEHVACVEDMSSLNEVLENALKELERKTSFT
jgi:hypothetical protein